MGKIGFASQNLTAGQLNAIVKNLGGEEGALKFLRGKLAVSEPPLDFIIRVDHSVRPSGPDWIKKLMHPELEETGPTEYNLQTGVEEWLHDQQKTDVVRGGHVIYDYFKANNDLVNHLGLADLLAIQAKGVEVFRKLYKGKSVFGWKSVVRSHSGVLHIPYLDDDGDKVVMNWRWLDSYWNSSSPALRFGK